MNDSEIIKKYLKFVYYIAGQCANNSSDIDDIVQEVFLKYVNNSPVFTNENAAREWFHVVTTRVAINFYSSKHFKYVLSLPEEDYESQPDKRDLIGEVEFEVSKETQLNSLDPLYQKLLFLRFDCGYSIKEISAEIGESIGKTKDLLERGKRAFRKIISDQYPEENNMKGGNDDD